MPAEPNEPDLLPTLYTCYRPVERYACLLARARGGVGSADFVAPLDAFLMHQLAACLEEPPQVIDLVADATSGASTALWATHPGVRGVIVPRVAAPGTPDRGGRNGEAGAGRDDFLDGWRAVLEGAAGELGFDPSRVDLRAPPVDTPGAWEALRNTLEPGAPILLVLPPAAETVRTVFAALPAAQVLLSGLGRPGHDPQLGPLLAMCETTGARLTALRDLGPFFHASALAVVCRGEDAAEAALERVRQLFDGNFDFLVMARALVASAEREVAGEGAARVGAEVLSAGHTKAPQRAYLQAVARMQKLVHETVPACSTVLVVSRGDDDLLNLGGRRAWHFPQTEDGVYAGHYPADSAAAVAHLLALRDRGADVLMLPVTAFWWLRQYAGFARHLEENCELLARQDDACALYSLIRKPGVVSKLPTTPRNVAPAGRPRGGLWRWLRGGRNGSG